jgi:hypothetical protein
MVFDNNSANVTEYFINQIQKITFSSDRMVLHKTNQTTEEKLFVDFSKITYQGIPQGVSEVNTDIFSMYPTKVSNSLHVRLNSMSALPAKVQIVNLQGVVLLNTSYSNTGNELNIPVSKLSQGMYLLIIENGGIAQTSRFIKL